MNTKLPKIVASFNPNRNENTKVKFVNFEDVPPIHKLDFLKDALYDIEQEYDKILKHELWEKKMSEEQNTSGITGYTDPTETKKELVNKFKAHEEALWDLIAEAQKTGLVDGRTMATGITQSELAYMTINRAVFQPRNFYSAYPKETK